MNKTLETMKRKMTSQQENKDLKNRVSIKKSIKKVNYHWPFDLKDIAKKPLHIFSLIMLMVFISNPIYSQSDQTSANNAIAIKGKIVDENGPLDKVSITLKGTRIGTISNIEGVFNFPKDLNKGDILIFSHLGYNKHEETINENSSYLEITMTLEVVEMLGALQVNTLYKSKRKK